MTDISLMNSVRRLINYEPNEIANICEYWALHNGYRKIDRRRKDNRNTYDIGVTKGNRVDYKVEFYLYGQDRQELMIVMRKRGGDYVIIGRTNASKDRMIEVDSMDYTWHYDANGLREIIRSYPDLFRELGVKE